jgi:phosphopantetheinyl transferase (holo-ACP synthase)
MIVGVGVDLCLAQRVWKTYTRFGVRFLERAFHANEVAALQALLAEPQQEEGAAVSTFLASRYRFVACHLS